MPTKNDMSEAIIKLRSIVQSFPPETPSICRIAVDEFLQICFGYSEWVNELQKIIVAQDADIKRLRSTVDNQGKKLAEFTRPSLILPGDST